MKNIPQLFSIILFIGSAACNPSTSETEASTSNATTESGDPSASSTSDSETQSPSGTETTVETDTADPSDTQTTDPSDTQTDSQTTDPSDTQTDSLTTDPSATETEGMQGLCLDACEHAASCTDITIEECVAGCEVERPPSEASEECRGAYDKYLECLIDATCDELEGDECEPVFEEALLACSECWLHGETLDTTCYYAYTCGEVAEWLMDCIDGSCTCYENNMEVGGCAAQAMCEPPDDQLALMNECCGFGL